MSDLFISTWNPLALPFLEITHLEVLVRLAALDYGTRLPVPGQPVWLVLLFIRLLLVVFLRELLYIGSRVGRDVVGTTEVGHRG